MDGLQYDPCNMILLLLSILLVKHLLTFEKSY